LARLEAWRGRPVFHPALVDLFDAVGASRRGLERLVLRTPFLVRTLLKPRLMAESATRAALTDTINITGFEAGNGSVNVVPSVARATLDCRLLPGTTPEAMKAQVARIIDDPGVRIELEEGRASNESPTDDSLYRALARRAVEGRSDAVAGPILSVGFTDSIYLRPLGVHAYGFVPFEVTLEDAGTMHGHGERVSVENLRNGLRILYRAIHDVVAGEPAPIDTGSPWGGGS
jgi:carboxypeptidase PM20D1